MAGTKIRGLTIELSADATGVLDAVKKINTQMKSTSTSLRDVDKLLKFNPTNMTLLSQKTQLLQKQIGQATTKLGELKTAQADMDTNGVDKNSEQYQALQREIIATEQEIQKLKSTMGSGSSTLAQISAVTGAWGQKLETVGKSIMPLSLGASAGLTAAAKSAIDFETAFAGVQKTVDGTPEQLDAIKQGIIDMSERTASSATDIASVAESAGQLGIATDDILGFTETMVMLGDTTNLSADEAASALAKFANITGTSASDYGRLGSTIVSLGNNFATTEADIVAMASNLASAGRLAGLTEPEILALSTSMSSVGIEAAAGGTAMTQTLTQIEKAVAGSGSELTKIASIAGMSAEEFSAAWEQRPIDALTAFISGLGDLDEQGESATLVLDELGMSGIRQSNMLKSLSLASDMMTGAVNTANGAWTENTALTNEASQKYNTTAAQISQLKATLTEVGIQLGNILLPIIRDVINWVKNAVKAFSNLDDGTKKTIVTIAGIAAAAGPLLVTGGKILKGISSITGALSKMGGISFGPIGIAIAAITALSAAGVALFEGWKNAYQDASPFTEALEEIKTKNDELSTSISTTKSNYENTVAATEANAAAADGLYQHLQNLIAAYDGTATSQLAIQTTIDELNEVVPGLGLSWDSVTNSLNLNEQEIYAHINAMKAQAQVAALQDMYTESLKEQYTAQKNLTESAKTLQGVMDQHGVTIQELYGIMADGNVTTGEAIQFLTSHGLTMKEAQGYTEELVGSLQGYLDARQNQADADSNVTFAETELTNAMVTAAEAAQTSSQTVIDSTNNINEQVNFDPAVQEATTDGAAIGASLASGMDSQAGTVTTSADGLASDVVNEFMNTPSEMNSKGSDSGSQLASGLQNEVTTVQYALQKLRGLFKSELSDIGELLEKEGTIAAQRLGKSITSGSSSQVSPAITAMIFSIRTKMAALPGMLSNIGSMAGQGLYSGLAAWEGRLAALANSIANSINAAARRALQVRSPSRVMMRVGEYTGEGLQIGLEKSAPAIYQTMDQIAGTIAGAVKPGMFNVGVRAMNAGVNSSVERSAAVAAAGTDNMSAILSLLGRYMPFLEKNKNIYFDNGTWAGVLAPAINHELGNIAVRAARG